MHFDDLVFLLVFWYLFQLGMNGCFSMLQVLSIIDSNYHVMKDMKDPSFPRFKGKEKQDQKEEKFVNYREKISVIIPQIGISLINCQPQVLQILDYLFSWMLSTFY